MGEHQNLGKPLTDCRATRSSTPQRCRAARSSVALLPGRFADWLEHCIRRTSTILSTRSSAATAGRLPESCFQALSSATAPQSKLTDGNELLLVADRNADVSVGEITYRARRGPGPAEGDLPWTPGARARAKPWARQGTAGHSGVTQINEFILQQKFVLTGS